ncbi:MAG: DUF3791 domain-containing protein [Bacteroidales bacterium]|nr:DUF3791 domain-containing protein [Bacteroidales bacterium]
MSVLQLNRIEYLICCIGSFAEYFGITNAQAYIYLNRYGGLDFLKKHYDIEHTFSIEDAVDDITRICHRNGGNLQ